MISPNRNSSFKRLTTWVIGFIQICWKVLWRSAKAELFIVSNPPFATLLPLFFRNRFKLLLFDIYPDALLEHNIVSKNSIISKLWGSANSRVFKKADKIFTLTAGMKSRASSYVDEDKVSVIPIWTDNDFFKPVPRDENIFLKENQLKDKFIIMYSGNLGFTHKVEILVDLANAFKDQNIEVLIVGEGARRTLIKERIKKLGVVNCKLLPWQPMAMLPYSFSAAHIGVVSLGEEASTLSLPSKTFNLMSVGIPLLSIAAKDSELADIVHRYDIGKCFAADDLNGMIEFVNKMFHDESEYNRLSANSRLASLNFTPKNAEEYLV